MSAELATRITEKLGSLRLPGADRDIVSMGLVSDVFVSQGKAYFSISVPADAANARRSCARASNNRAFEVPTGIPSVPAISSCV